MNVIKKGPGVWGPTLNVSYSIPVHFGWMSLLGFLFFLFDEKFSSHLNPSYF
jgi:hypothetical protein